MYQGTLAELKGRGGKQISIMATPLPKAAEFLQSKGYAVALKNNKLLVSGNVNPEILNRELVLNGFGVSHLSENLGNLEDIFLQLTGEAA